MKGDGNGDDSPRFVTLSELDKKLDKVPTRWEVRFLILAAFVGGQVVPYVQVNQPIRTGLGMVSRMFL